ncbi:MAG: hypothetical protein EOP47_10730 [Sphingobacteriaceae bacterium]|nr:MAG: hypothetical protein EOP47_10730 [Sphingobacteriaceae bacterium]
MEKEVETFYPATKKEWRKWLQKNHSTKQSIWVVMYKKDSGIPTITWSDAVDEAICFGWIDSTKRPVDHEKSIQYFTRRKPTSMWSKINKDKVERLTKDGLMAQAGINSVEIAKQNGSWNILDDVEALVVPTDLEKAFKKHKDLEAYYTDLSRSAKKMALHRLMIAKLPETREKRIKEMMVLAAKKKHS